MLTIKKPAAGWLAVVCAALLLTGCGPPGPRALLEGKRLLEQGKNSQAVETLRTAVSLLGNTNALAFNYLGLACQQAGQLAEAESAYRRALALDHDMAELHYNLGCLWLSQNKLEQAKAELTAYTLGRSGAVEGWIMLGTTQWRARELSAAERSFGEALRLAPQNPEALSGLGLVRLKRERVSEAVQLFERALKAQPDYAPAILNLGIVAQQNLNNRPLALAKYREYLALKPPAENYAAVKALAAELERQTTSPPPPAPLKPLGVAQSTNSSPVTKAPTQEMTRWGSLAKPPASVLAPATNTPKGEAGPVSSPPATTLQNRTATVAAKPAPPTGSNLAKRTTATGPPPFETVTLPADPVFKPAQDVAAAKAATGASLAAPETPGESGTAKQASPAPAKRTLLQRMNPINLFSRDETASATTSTKPAELPPDAGAKAPQAASEPAAKPAVQSFARYTYQSPARPSAGNRTEAERAFAQGLKAYQARRYAEAIQEYQRATHADPGYFDAYYNLALAATAAGKSSAALRAYETALAIRPEALDARYNFGLLLKQCNYPLDAANEFEKILAVYPDEPRAHLALGNLYAQQLAEPAKARQHYLKVLEIDPRNSQAPAIRYWLTK